MDYSTITGRVSAMMAAARNSGAIPPPDAIVDTIYQLAIGKKKTFRNVVGKDAKMVLFLRKLLPIRFFLNIPARRVS